MLILSHHRRRFLIPLTLVILLFVVALSGGLVQAGSGTVLVKDINPGSGRATPAVLTDVAGTLFFSTDDPTNGFELWKSDGATPPDTIITSATDGNGDAGPNSGSILSHSMTFQFIF